MDEYKKKNKEILDFELVQNLKGEDDNKKAFDYIKYDHQVQALEIEKKDLIWTGRSIAKFWSLSPEKAKVISIFAFLAFSTMVVLAVIYQQTYLILGLFALTLVVAPFLAARVNGPDFWSLYQYSKARFEVSNEIIIFRHTDLGHKFVLKWEHVSDIAFNIEEQGIGDITFNTLLPLQLNHTTTQQAIKNAPKPKMNRIRQSHSTVNKLERILKKYKNK